MYRWDPFADIMSLRDAMDRMMRESTGTQRGGAVSPPMEVTEESDGYRVRLALPGVKPEDVHIQVQQNVLSVSGEFRREEQAPNTRRYLHQEHTFGSFSRSISLPGLVDTDKATADFEHGMLTITLPKREEARPRRIPIGGAGSAGRTIEAQTTSGGSMAQSTQPGNEQGGSPDATGTSTQSSEERARVQQAAGFANNSPNMPVQGEQAQAEGGTVAARPPSAVDQTQPPSSQPK